MSQTEHGTTRSYIVGFISCLLLTALSYVAVVNKTVSGNQLLGAIVGLAMLQMLVQIFFFLHLGRGPKPVYNLAFFAGTVVTIVVVVGGSLFIMSHLHYNMLPTEAAKQLGQDEAIYQVEGNKTGACKAIKANHQIILTSSTTSPLYVEASLCDTLSFTNQDGMTREISFGSHTKPAPYAGQESVTVRKGKSETITLNVAGSYALYDHAHPELAGYFVVTK